MKLHNNSLLEFLNLLRNLLSIVDDNERLSPKFVDRCIQVRWLLNHHSVSREPNFDRRKFKIIKKVFIRTAVIPQQVTQISQCISDMKKLHRII